MTPEQYDKVMNFLSTDRETVNFIQRQSNGNASIEGAEFSWYFDGIDELRLFIVRLHSVKLHLLGCHRVFRMLIHRIDEARIL